MLDAIISLKNDSFSIKLILNLYGSHQSVYLHKQEIININESVPIGEYKIYADIPPIDTRLK